MKVVFTIGIRSIATEVTQDWNTSRCLMFKKDISGAFHTEDSPGPCNTTQTERLFALNIFKEAIVVYLKSENVLKFVFKLVSI